MANKTKHRLRSKRSYHSNSIPVAMFATYAKKVADAKFMRKMFEVSNMTAEAVEAAE
jgi:hypothetical protein